MRQVKHFSVIVPSTKLVEVFDVELKNLKEEMIEICHVQGGIGLAASQIGHDQRLFLFFHSSDGWTLACNPKFEPIKNAGLSTEIEGCLSVPGETFKIRRWESIQASWIDELGNQKCQVLTGSDARVFQHEHDHLSAKSIRDRFMGQYRSGRFEASRQKKKLIKKRRS